MLLLAIDVGNSSCHAGLFQDTELLASTDWKATGAPPHDPGLGTGLLPEAFLFASVNPPAEPALLRWARELGLRPECVPRDVPYPIPVRVEGPGLVGPDRVLSAAAALHICREPCIVVDAGTATPVDFATPEDGFLGGAILPGFALMAGALHGGTSRLPEVPPSPTEDPLGTSTEGAIRAGAFLGWVGAVKELVRRLRERNGPVPVFVTGGDGRHLVAQLPAEARMVEGLVLRGIQLAWELAAR
jgi:type III pantothenate kinase